MIPVTITPSSINLFLDGRMRTISKSHINHNAVRDTLKRLSASGEVVTEDRNTVDDDRNATCSRGLHFCSWQYLPHFYCGAGEKVVVVKVAPEDVVAIPYDYNNSKGRTWRYAVLSEVPKDECEHLFNNKPIVTSFGAYDSGLDYDDDVYLDEDEDLDVVDDCECTEVCEATDLDCPLIEGSGEVCADPCCDGVDGTDMVFTHRGNTWTGTQVKENVDDFGQRGWSAMSGVPRTTIQEWLKRIN